MLSAQMTYFTVSVIKHWNGFMRDGINHLPLKVFKSRLGVFSGVLLHVWSTQRLSQCIFLTVFNHTVMVSPGIEELGDGRDGLCHTGCRISWTYWSVLAFKSLNRGKRKKKNKKRTKVSIIASTFLPPERRARGTAGSWGYK